VAEAIFTSEQVKDFAQVQWPAVPALVFTKISRLAKDFFMRNGPGNTGHGQTD
jgi:hypothetical protein